ncbi:hypothetical protein GCM10010431_73250 [Streptomyces kunmingensis]
MNLRHTAAHSKLALTVLALSAATAVMTSGMASSHEKHHHSEGTASVTQSWSDTDWNNTGAGGTRPPQPS